MGSEADTFSDSEIAVLRFLQAEYLQNTRNWPADCPESKSIIERFNLEQGEYYSMMARFEASGWVTLGAKGHNGEFVKIDPSIVEIVRRLANPPLPDYRDKVTKWFWSKPWSMVAYILVVGVPALLGWVVMLKTILEWLGIRK